MPQRRFDDDREIDESLDSFRSLPLRFRGASSGHVPPHRKGRLTEETRDLLADRRHDEADGDQPVGADRWSTWDQDGSQRGPEPWPDWLITGAATDTELGVLKTGKEADVHLVRRAVPGTHRSCLLAAKRYRTGDHRLFHRDAGYLEGRRVRQSREMRALQRRTGFGRNLIAERWAAAEFDALVRLHQLGVAVPYPVQRTGTELLVEFVGDPDGTGAPRLAQLRPGPAEVASWWDQVVDALEILAGHGLAHGDLSAFNILVHHDRLILIDLPQLVDVVANPGGSGFLERDVRNIAAWFSAHGLDRGTADPGRLLARLRTLAGLG